MHKIFDNHYYGDAITCLHKTHALYFSYFLASPIMDCLVVQNTEASN